MGKLKRVLYSTSFAAVCLCILLFVLAGICTPNIFSLDYINRFLPTNVPMLICTMGIAYVLIGGFIDISLGSVVSLVNVVSVSAITLGCPVWLAIIIGIAVGTLCGLVNGLLIGAVRINALLTTFATSSVFAGAALWIMPMPSGSFSTEMLKFYNESPLGLSNSLIYLIIAIIIWLLIKMTPWKIKLYALGQNEMKAYVSGIPAKKMQVIVYVLAGFITGIGAMALTNNMGGGNPLLGDSYSMNTIVACVIGGVSMQGGKGSMFGAILGAVFVGLISNAVVSFGVVGSDQKFVTGLIMLGGMILLMFLDSWMSKRAMKLEGGNLSGK